MRVFVRSRKSTQQGATSLSIRSQLLPADARVHARLGVALAFLRAAPERRLEPFEPFLHRCLHLLYTASGCLWVSEKRLALSLSLALSLVSFCSSLANFLERQRERTPARRSRVEPPTPRRHNLLVSRSRFQSDSETIESSDALERGLRGLFRTLEIVLARHLSTTILKNQRNSKSWPVGWHRARLRARGNAQPLLLEPLMRHRDILACSHVSRGARHAQSGALAKGDVFSRILFSSRTRERRGAL